MTTMTFGEAVKIVKAFASRNTEGDILWALGEMRDRVARDEDITQEEAIAWDVFVTEGQKFFAPAEV